jgi:hypothetical protein
MPRRRGHEDIEACTAVVPLLKRRRFDGDVAEGGELLASECGHFRARLDGGHRASERCQRACRLAGTAAHLKHRRPFVHAGDGDEVCEQLVGVSRPDPVVELRHLVEHPTEVTSIRACHRTILPVAVSDVPILGKHMDGRTVWSARDPPSREIILSANVCTDVASDRNFI